MKYPKIKRDIIDFTSDTEVCNIGFYEGTLKDGRPIRAEKWVSHEIENVTLFFSIIDFENKTKQDIKDYLIKNNIIKILNDEIYITEIEDINENTFISVNVPVLNHLNVLNEVLLDFKDYNI